MAIGDAMIALAVFFGTGATLWAVLLVLDLLFPRRVEASAHLVQTASGKSFGIGVLLAGVGVVLGLGLLNGAGPLKLFGIILLGFLAVVASLGSAGIARIVSERVRDRTVSASIDINRLGDRARDVSLPDMKTGAALLIGAGMLPVIGWFFIFPVLFVLSVGVGVQALRKERTEKEVRQALPLREGVTNPWNP